MMSNGNIRRREDSLLSKPPERQTPAVEVERRAADRRANERRHMGRRRTDGGPSESQLQAISTQHLEALELERSFVARSLQHSIADHLLSVKYTLEGALHLGKQGENQRSSELVEDAVANIREVLGEIRGLSTTLRPSILDELGAASAIAWLCRQFVEHCPGTPLETYIDATDSQIPRHLNTVLFRSVQSLLGTLEALSPEANIELSLRARDDVVSLVLVDDLPPESLSTPLVMADEADYHSLRKRVIASGGQINVRTARQQSGTVLHMSWPVQHIPETDP